MTIDLLKNHEHLIPEIAELKFKEFHYLVPDKTLEDFTAGIKSHLNEAGLPITYVIVENKKLVGTFSLRQCDLPSHHHLSPWIGSVIVNPEKRNAGIGSSLVKQALKIAKLAGHDHLYLFTPNKAAWYSKLGWQTVEETFFNTIPVTIMCFNLNNLD